MSERATLRGSRLVSTSFEDEAGIEFAPRQQVTYDCANGHEFGIPMAEDAEIPYLWECPRCGAESKQRHGTEPEAKEAKPARTHWDMLMERRSISDLEDILTERLELLRAGEIGPPHLHRKRGSRKSA